jgi:6-phosphogluconolactonase/glucosamine-6-phosphate isomerase/deaminase
MAISELMEWIPLFNSTPFGIEAACAGIGLVPGLRKLRGGEKPPMVQERTGFHLGIAPEIRSAGRYAASVARDSYRDWLAGESLQDDTAFKRRYFTIAVGGGNTIKNEYRALLRHHFRDIDWLDHVRFFFLEETCNEKNWESTRDALVENFIEPLARKLISTRGTRELTELLDLNRSASHRDITRRIVERMIYSIDLTEVEAASSASDRASALEAAEREARRYQGMLRKFLGPSMSFHLIISGIGKNGGLGAFAPYTPELRRKKPAVLSLDKPNGAISVAVNRGVLTAADRISLIIAGSLKLRALGRFEMDDSANFEQTVMETPIRMLRENQEIAEKVYIFADDRALLFEEGVFQYREDGHALEIKSEVREGDEPGGIHILLVHGFMGLYSYINLLIRLPSAWRVSALRRGTHAKTLPHQEVFPHYASALRKMLLRNWRAKRPTPICCHSMAGIISDHVLLSILDDYDDPLPEFDQLKQEDRRLVEALQIGGVIHIATWAPSDTNHITRNTEAIRANKEDRAAVDFSGPTEIYELDRDGKLALNEEHRSGMMSTPPVLEKIMKLRSTETLINGINVAIRFMAARVNLQKLLKQESAPYGQRLLGSRVLKKVSFYGVLKEINAAMHDPHEYQARHLKAVEAILKYDIPYLVIVHNDDFMVSANRHIQEHEYLLAARMKKEGVTREKSLKVPARLILLKGDEDKPTVDLVDPHFLILSHSHEGGGNARKVTAAMTTFVNENAARAAEEKRIKPLPSVEKWKEDNRR